MAKIKLTDEFVKRAKASFEASKSKYVSRKELGLTRGEIRLLERADLVEKMQTFGERKFSATAPSMMYVWRWKNESK